jgi:hypothetical protein
MPKIDSYSLDSSITDTDSLLGVNAADGKTKRYTMSAIKTALLEGADITAVIAGTGLSGGATTGAATLTIDSTVTTLTGSQTLTNKTLTAPVLSGSSSAAGSVLFKEDTDNGTNAVTLIGPASTADVTLTLPSATDTLVGKATTDTLTNKTLTSPSIATPTWTATESAIANGDYVLFLDTSASSETKKDALADIATLFAGTGLTASSSEIGVDASQTQITGVGTITTGTWQASLVGIDYGGTGLSGETDGYIVIADGSGAATHLDVGSSSGITILGTIATGVWQGTAIDTAYIDTTLTSQTSMLNTSLVVGRDADNQIKFSTDNQIIFEVSGGDNVIFKASGEIEATSLDISGDADIGGDLTISGDFTVSGDTTTVNTATLSVEDPLIIVGSGNNSSDVVDLGFYGLYDTSTSQDLYAGLFRDASDSGKWKLFKSLQTAPTTTVNTSGTGYAVDTLVANLEGTVTGNASGLSATLAVSSGGTNATSFADKSVIITQDSSTDTLSAAAMTTSGSLLIGGSSGPAVGTLTAGSNVSITNADGAITLAVSAAGEAFKTISVSGQSDIVADGVADTLTFVAGTGTTITTNASTDTVTINAGANTVEVDEYTGNGSTTAYTLSTTCTSENNLLVYMDGVFQHHNTYAVSGTTLTFDTNVPNGSKVEAYHMISVSNSNMVQLAVAGTLMDVSGGTGDVTFNVDLTEAGEAAIANGDYILFLDGGATGTHAKEAIADVATLFAGTGLTASSSVINIDAAQTGITSLLATDIKIGEDDQTKVDFETADTINFYAGNEKQLILTDGALTPGSNAIVDLGTDALEFKDAYFDGTVEADAITIGGTAIGSIYSPVAGHSSIATVGTIGTGTWQGTAIASTYIASDAITAAKIADNAIDSEHYTDGSIDNAHIADNAIDSEHYADGSIDNAHLADDAVNSDEIAAGAIDLAHMSVNSIDSDQYVDGSIDLAHMSVNSIDSDQYVDGSIDNAHIADNAINYEKVDDEFTTVDALSAAATVAVDFDAAQVFTLTPDQNTTLNITNPKIGITKTVIMTGSGGSRTLAFQVGGSSGTFNKIAGDYDDTSSKKNLISITCVAATEFWYAINQIAS